MNVIMINTTGMKTSDEDKLFIANSDGANKNEVKRDNNVSRLMKLKKDH